MTFRTRLLLVFALTILASVGMVVWIVSRSGERTFEHLDQQRTAALVEQFYKEFERRGSDIAAAAGRVAKSDAAVRAAIDVKQGAAAAHVGDATDVAAAQGLDFLELVAPDGTIVSSAQSPARFGFKEAWLEEPVDWSTHPAFLRREDLPDESALALEAVRVTTAGDAQLYVVAGRRLDQTFLTSLVLPAGMRALLYRNLDSYFQPQFLTGVSPNEAQHLTPLIERTLHDNRGTSAEVQWTPDAATAETFHTIPLKGRDGRTLGVLLIGSSRRELAGLVHSIRKIGLYVGAAGALLALALAAWATARVTRPVKLLSAGAAEVARGNWRVRVETGSSDEIGDLARAFNQMTDQLSDQRERLVQSERVAAWRELARRLAHELKNPLFPLQITVENLERAKREHPAQFEEVFRESTATLLAELANLKAIIARFSDFAKMPTPQFERTQLNDLVRAVLKLVEAQLAASGKIQSEARLDPSLPPIEADPEQIKRAVQNLVLNALDAMPNGGALRLSTRQYNSTVILEVADSGQGLTQEECGRLFTPYYTTKHHGTGLGLAIVQSVVSDHHGTISVESQPGRGAAFRIELPIAQPTRT